MKRAILGSIWAVIILYSAAAVAVIQLHGVLPL